MSEWKEHDGGPQPDETKGKRVKIETREGGDLEIEADRIIWPWLCDVHPSANIFRYRLLDAPSSDEGMARGIPEPLDEHVKTLRDEIAIAALPAFIAGRRWDGSIRYTATIKAWADCAYAVADAAIAARKGKMR